MIKREAGKGFCSKNLSPKCSLSIGFIARVSKNLPPATRLSLLASASFLPRRCVFMLGISPAKPTSAFTTVSLSHASSISKIPLAPAKIRVRSMLATCETSFSSPTQTNLGRNFAICAFKDSTFLAQLIASTLMPAASQISSVWTPMLPVEPKTTTKATKEALRRRINSRPSDQASRRAPEIARRYL